MKKKHPLNPLQQTDFKIINDVYENRPTRPIEKEYASLLVEMLSIQDTSQLADSVYKIRQLDSKLKGMGLRATVNVGNMKIG